MTKGWTPERRAAQAARIRETKPWTKATGPRTPEGKRRSSQNAYKHGGTRAVLKTARKALRLQRAFMATTAVTLHAFGFDEALRDARNELNEKRPANKRLQAGTENRGETK